MDTLLGKLDEFEQLMVLSQSDANVCLFKHVPGLQTKFTEMQSVFDKIDRYVFIFILNLYIFMYNYSSKIHKKLNYHDLKKPLWELNFLQIKKKCPYQVL